MPVDITNLVGQAASGLPGEIDSLFVPAHIENAGLPLDRAISVRSISDYVAQGGVRADNPAVYDGLDNFFREQGRQAYVGRYTDAGTIDSGLALFTENLGGGQLVDWDSPPDAISQARLLDTAAAQKRYAILDVGVDDTTVAQMQAVAAVVPDANNDYGFVVGPWVTIPAPVDLIGGGERQVPASSSVAALIARADALGNPNRAPAGRDFPLQYATGFVSAPLSDADAAALRASGVNPLRNNLGVLVLDGFVTTRPVNRDDPFWQANPPRGRMWLQWRAKGIGLNYEYKPIDGRGRIQSKLKTDLDVMCKELWDADGLFGITASEAYRNEVGVSLNTDATIADGELNAVCEARFTQHAQTVKIALVSVPITGRVSAAA